MQIALSERHSATPRNCWHITDLQGGVIFIGEWVEHLKFPQESVAEFFWAIVHLSKININNAEIILTNVSPKFTRHIPARSPDPKQDNVE